MKKEKLYFPKDKFKFKLTQKEMAIIKTSLENYYFKLNEENNNDKNKKILEKLNNKLFDAEEYENINKLKDDIIKIKEKFNKKLDKIIVW